MPFERLVELMQVTRAAGRTPLFQTTFALQDFPAVKLQLQGVQSQIWPCPTGTSKFDLSLTVIYREEQWVATMEYSADLFEEESARQMLSRWSEVLVSVARDPGQKLSEIPLSPAHPRSEGISQEPQADPGTSFGLCSANRHSYAGGGLESPFVAPRNNLEHEVALIWRSLLKRPKVGVHDHFLDLGGHSLLALSICSQLRQKLNIEIPLRWIFDYPTLDALASKIRNMRQSLGESFPIETEEASRRVCEPSLIDGGIGARSIDNPAGDALSNALDSTGENTCIHDVFTRQANLSPNRIAIECDKKRLTYAELDSRSSQWAESLRERGVGPEVSVGFYFQRSLDAAVAALAILKAGGALVPLDPAFPKERISFVISDTKMRWVITHSSLENDLPLGECNMLYLDRTSDLAVSTHPSESREVNAEGGTLACVLYTSGSTGQPKGVLLTHGAFLSYWRAAVDLWQLKASDR